MTGQLRGVLTVLLALAMAGAPADTLVAPGAVANSELPEPSGGAEELSVTSGSPLRLQNPASASAGGAIRPAELFVAARDAGGIRDHVPRRVRLCSWRE